MESNVSVALPEDIAEMDTLNNGRISQILNRLSPRPRSPVGVTAFDEIYRPLVLELVTMGILTTWNNTRGEAVVRYEPSGYGILNNFLSEGDAVEVDPNILLKPLLQISEEGFLFFTRKKPNDGVPIWKLTDKVGDGLGVATGFKLDRGSMDRFLAKPTP